jgi:hypothetical protein
MTKSENRWMCQNCHTPLLVQQQRWPTDLVDGDVERPVWVENPSFDEELQQEGITCAACHLRGGVIVGPTGAPTDAHPTAADPSYTNETFCLRCHQATATYPGKTFTCTFHTGEEWAAGPYGKAGQPCQTCHMKEATDEAGKTHRRHWWAGGGLGKVAGVYPPPEALPPGLVVTAVRDGADLRVDLVNANAGHMVPTGDPERFYWIELTFRDETGAAIGAPWTTRVGQTWEWWPTPRQLGDNRVPPGGQRTERAPIPAGAVDAALVVTRNRMTPETRDYHHLGDYPIGAEVKREIIPLNP